MYQKPDMRAPEPDSDEIDLAALGATIWAGKAWVAGATVGSAALAGLYLFLTPPTYQADALLQIESGKSLLALSESMSNLLGSDNASTLAEMEILRSRHVLGRAVADLNLDWVAAPRLAPVIGPAMLRHDLPAPDFGPFAAYARKGDSIALAYLEVPPEWLGREMVLTKTGNRSFTLALPDGGERAGVVGELLSDKTLGFALQVTRLDGADGRQFRILQQTELAAIASLSSALTVVERGRQTGIVEVRLQDGDKAAARIRLDAVVRAYAEQNVDKSAAEAQKSLDFVESQLPLAKAAVADAERKLNDYRAAQNSVDLEFETQSLLTEATGIEGQLRDLKLKEDELKDKYMPNHPLYRQLLQERDALLARLDELQAGISALPETQREVVNLSRTLEVAQATYVELMNRAQELRVLSASQIGSVRIIDHAATQAVQVAPRPSRIMALALVLGLMTGIAAVMARNWLRRGVDSVQEIERIGVPVFATVNQYGGTAKGADGHHLLVAREDPENIVVEALRSLRTSLHFGMLDSRTKSLVLTSSAPGAGKSFIAANLALVAAQAGQRVCLIDGDMRRGTQRKYFGLPRSLPGLADYLAEDQELEGVLRESGVPNLSVIMTGPIPPNPSELLMRNRLGQLISSLDEVFDLVIVDAPPALAVTDAVIIGRTVGSVIAVVRHGLTPIGEVESLRNTLETACVKLKGAIFNGYDPRRAKAGGGRYGYGYGYGYRNRYSYRSDRQ